MTKELFALLCAAFVVLVALLVWLGIRGRRRRQRDITAPQGWIDATPSLVVDALYVATTRAGDPYDRIFAHGLGFRGRTRMAIDADGVQLLADRRELRIPATSIRSVERATWTIDRVVEPGGIIVIAHELGADVDTYVRVIGDDAPAFEALSALARGTTTTTAGEGLTP
ncbi:hypothetical protein SAMN04487783_2695 [Agrococcus baldri]|uniref:PH domain-containing protein n=1 Tax=Agrococcus baldri TaxID=153730 RepID=A0AA94HPI8_9MICO|nr:hypothetical protein [Agrococcus baldri]SFS18627.1 hypothetical protein SAMN04487783_2695 [Agrococcus baldri]